MDNRLDKITIPAISLVKKGVIHEIISASREKKKSDKKFEREFQKTMRNKR